MVRKMAVLAAMVCSVCAYSADTLQLREAVVVERNRQRALQHELEDFQTRSVNGLLAELSSVYLRNYGPGQLSGMSFRGTSTAQNEVSWNGLSLNSPMHGQADLSLLQAGLFDKISLESGSSSGVIGARLELGNSLRFGGGFKALASFRYGSFGQMVPAFHAEWSNSRWMVSGFAMIHRSVNDLIYPDPFSEGRPERRLRNADLRSLTLGLNVGLIAGKADSLQLGIQFHGANRGLPNIALVQAPLERQSDAHSGLLIRYAHGWKHAGINYTAAWLRDGIRYMNPIAGIRDTGISHAFRNAVGWKGKWNRWFLNGAVHGEWETAGGRSYPGGRISRARFRVQQQVSCELGKGFGLLLSIRQEITGTQASPFMPGLELSRRGYKGKLSYISRINVYRKFRAPSLNDLYWSGAGNPDLKSESAWSTEAVFGMQFGRAFDFQIRGYWMRVNNWILWTPQQGGNWQPKNEWLVLSRGAEADIRWNVLHALVSRKWKLEINMSYAFNKADVKDAGGLTPLMYAPRHRLIAGMLLGWEGLWLRSWINVMSLRYTDRAGKESLPAVLIPHLEAGYLYTKGHFQIGGFFRCSNPGNTFYQEVVMRPMPGRMLEGGITFGYR